MLDPVNKTTPKSLRLTENTECVRTDVIVLMSHVTLQHFFFSMSNKVPSIHLPVKETRLFLPHPNVATLTARQNTAARVMVDGQSQKQTVI